MADEAVVGAEAGSEVKRKRRGRLKKLGRVLKRVSLAVGGAATGGVLPDVLHVLGEAAVPAVVEAASEAAGAAEDPVEAWAVRLGGALAGLLLALTRMKRMERAARRAEP